MIGILALLAGAALAEEAPAPVSDETKVQVLLLQKEAERVKARILELRLEAPELTTAFRQINDQLNAAEKKIRIDSNATEEWILTPDLRWRKKKE
jgi:hypothetical protein